MTENALPGPDHWVDCRCCGRAFPAENVVRFTFRPQEALCVSCVNWLHDLSRPIARRLYPIWRLPSRIRTRMGGKDTSHPDEAQYAADSLYRTGNDSRAA